MTQLPGISRVRPTAVAPGPTALPDVRTLLDRAGATAAGVVVPRRFLPAPARQAEQHPATGYIKTFFSLREAGETPLTEEEITAALGEMSAYDCLAVLGRVSSMLHPLPPGNIQAQRGIMRRLGLPEDQITGLTDVLEGPEGPAAIFFPQQITHLMRMVVLHGDDRPADDFDNYRLVGSFLRCLFSVPDLFFEPGLEDGDGAIQPEVSIPWILRQLGINHSPDSILLWSRYYALIVKIWPEVSLDKAFDAADAFKAHTGITLEEWLTVGFGLYARFLSYGNEDTDEFFLEPGPWLSNTALDEATWRPFVEANSQTLDQTRAALVDEEANYGPTQYRSHTFDTRPLLAFPDGRLIPLGLDALERRATEGIFYELADAAAAAGARGDFTTPFGRVFEEFVQRAWERMLPTIGAPRVHRASPYRRGGKQVDATDVVLDFGQTLVFCEVVAHRQKVATVTRGDWTAFLDDLEKGVLHKARQLDANIIAFRDGDLVLDGINAAEIKLVRPMIVIAEGFPLMPPIPDFIRAALARDGLLQGLPPLAILGTSDLAILEALVERGFGVEELLVSWLVETDRRDLPFPNFINTLDDRRLQGAKRAAYYEKAWEDLSETVVRDTAFPKP